MSRLAALATLVAAAALATCGYSPMPQDGRQVCASGTGKLCPDGYHCVTETNGNHCYRDGSAGAGGALSGAAGKGGAGGDAGGGGAPVAGAGGGGAGGTTVLPVCTASAANMWFGSLSTIGSGAVAGPMPTATSSGVAITGNTLGPGPAAVGAAFTFSPCVDAQASHFTGVSFSIMGSVSVGCTPLFQMDDSEGLAAGKPGPVVPISNLSSSTPQTIQVPWSTVSPNGPFDDTHLAILVWGVTIPAGGYCSVNYSITNLSFY